MALPIPALSDEHRTPGTLPHDLHDIALQASLICQTPAAAIIETRNAGYAIKAVIGESKDALSEGLTAFAEVIGRSTETFECKKSPLFEGSAFNYMAGCCFTTGDGEIVGAICVFDQKIRSLSAEQKRALKVLARQTMERAELRRELTAAASLLQDTKEQKDSPLPHLKTFQALMERLPAVAYVKSDDNRIVYGHPAIAEKDGTANPQLLNKFDAELRGEDAAEVAKNDQQVLKEKRPILFEETTRHPEGSTVHWLSLKFPVHGAEGEKLIAGISIDITGQMQHLHEIEEHLQYLDKSLERFKRLSLTDSLTQLANRAAFEEVLKKDCEMANRSGSAVCLVLLGLDHFQQINDTCGDATGDEVLRRMGQILTNNTRSRDLPARWGGEEFAILLRHVDRTAALSFAERLRSVVENSDWPSCRVTASVGVSLMDKRVSADTLREEAVTALHRAKQAGRNRVEI